MLTRLRLILIALAAAAATLAQGVQGAQAQGYSRQTAQVISQAFAATGGSGWYLLRGWHETGREGGLAYERWIDPVRYGLRVETREPAGLRIHGFNGQAVWQVAPSGAMTAVNDHATLAEARTAAFFTAQLFLFPGRFGARGDYLGVRRKDGRAYQVVVVTPWNGRARELWFDAGSHLLARIVDRSGPRPAAIAVSDYRKVGPVRVAFHYAPEVGGPARQIDSLAFTPAVRDAFSLDRAEALAKVRAVVAP
ncbi:MAG: hypothetical protein JWQ97_3365 [Phenylobacterium sp.]|nr:hypothetical protein [Phenylobacterium sp.]